VVAEIVTGELFRARFEGNFDSIDCEHCHKRENDYGNRRKHGEKKDPYERGKQRK